MVTPPFLFDPLGQLGFSAFRWVAFFYVQNPPGKEAETPHCRFPSPDVAFLFSSTDKVASTGIPLCHLSWCFDLNSRKGEDGQQEIWMCLVTVQVADGEIRLLASGTSPSGGIDVYLYIERGIYTYRYGALLSQEEPQNCPSQARAPQCHCTVAISAASLETSQGAVQ